MVASSRYPNFTQSPGNITNIGGISNVCMAADQTLTRPANTTAYAAGQALGSDSSVIFSFGDTVNYPSAKPFFRYVNSSALLTSIRLGCSLSGITASNMGSVIGHVYQTSPTAAEGLVDQNQYPVLQADSPKKLGLVLFNTWFTGGTGSDLIESYGSPVLSQHPIIAAADTQSLFVVCVANSSFTPASSAIFHLHASSIND